VNASLKGTFSGDEDIIVFHGNDEFAIKDSVKKILEKSGAFSDLNTSNLNAIDVSRADISMQLAMLPLGIGKRIVIIEHAQAKLDTKPDQEWWDLLLKTFSPSTQLILILDDEQEYKRSNYFWKRYPENSWLRKSLQTFSGDYFWQEYLLPGERQMPEWIQTKAKNLGGSFHPTAAHALANLIGSDLFQAQHEIEKAIAYVGEGQQVSVEDVLLLCPAAREEGVFDLVDAVGQRDGNAAMRIYQKLRVDMPEQIIFSQLARQIRLLLQTCYVLDQKASTQQVMEVCDTSSSWFANKLIKQARRFSSSELERIYNDLDCIDVDSKKGIISIEVAIETFLAQVTQ
jgi:DNA polymerase-3 subunit delta